MTEWYYVSNSEQIGPVDEIAMRSLIRTGEVVPKTYVWKADMTDWLPAAETELKIQFPEISPKAVSESLPQQPKVELPDFSAESMHTLWLWFACTIGVALPLYYLISNFLSETVVLVIIGMVAITASAIGCVLLYRFWALIQDGTARTTPGKAVGFCFIPIYNIYWNYVAYVGLVADINSYCDERNIDGPRVDNKLANIWYILSILAIIPGVGAYFSAPVIILQIMLIKQLSDLSQAIIKSRKVG